MSTLLSKCLKQTHKFFKIIQMAGYLSLFALKQNLFAIYWYRSFIF
jgi:hypothetical protein